MTNEENKKDKFEFNNTNKKLLEQVAYILNINNEYYEEDFVPIYIKYFNIKLLFSLFYNNFLSSNIEIYNKELIDLIFKFKNINLIITMQKNKNIYIYYSIIIYNNKLEKEKLIYNNIIIYNNIEDDFESLINNVIDKIIEIYNK